MAAHDGGFCCYFSCCWDLRFLFCCSIVLSLFICLIQKNWNGRFLQDSRRFWGRSSARAPLSADPRSKMQQVPPERRDRAQEAFRGRRGLKEAVPSRHQDGVSQRSGQDSIRQLLCDDASCSICNKAATEARKLAYPKGLGFRFNLTPAPPVPIAYQKGCSELLDVSEMPVGAPSPRSVPCPTCPHSRPTSGAPLVAAEGTSSHSRDLSGVVQKKQKKKLTMTMTAKKKRRSSSQEKRGNHSPSSSCSEEECFYCSGPKEHFHSATSGVLKVSFTSRTDYTSSASGHSESQEEVLTCSLRIESEASSISTQSEGVPKKKAHRGGHRSHRSHKHRRKRETGPHSGATQWSQGGEGATVDTPFLEEAVRAKLEWHLLRKRVQHAMSLPLSLVRSLRAFIPLAPDSIRKRPSRNIAVVVHPQALPFLRPEGARAELERHLKKMVHLKRWGLPQKVQEALGHMQPSTGHRSSTFLEKEDQQVVSRRTGKTHQQAKDMEGFHPAHATPDGHFQKVAAPKPIHPVIGRHLHPSRVLFSQGKVGAMKSTRERAPFRGSTYSLTIGAAGTLRQPSWMSSSASEAVAVTPSDLACLESHILQKRVHHQWGLPILIQRSLEQFFPAPPQPSTRPVLTRCFLWEERTVTISSHFTFIPPETAEKLNSHLRSLVVERRWGLPRRVMESLQKFAPDSLLSPEMPRAREVGPSFPSARRSRVKQFPAEKPPVPYKRLPGFLGSQPSDSCWGQKGQILQKNLAKRALEVQLNVFPPLVQYSQGVSERASKDILPKILPPGQKTARHRTGDLPFLERSACDRIELNIAHKNLSYRWGLPTIYTKSLAHFFLGMEPMPSRVSPVLPGSFVPRETTFLAREAREVLEWHIRWKRVQHTWGLPSLALISLRCLLPTVPQLCRPQHRPRPEEVSIVPGPLLFLHRETKQKLEANVRKRVILQQWGLPRRVRQSLKLLCPNMVFHPARTYTVPGFHPPRPQRHPHRSSSAGLILSSHRRGQGAISSVLGPKAFKKIKSHMTRRLVEMQLGQPPPVVRTSWRLALLSIRQPLPRLILPGQESLRPRNSFLPFSRTEDLQQIGLAICRRHLSSLWGLGLHYVEALSVVVPKPSTRPLRPQRMPGTEFSEVGTPFLPHADRDVLELHVRTKRLQHQWGVPAFLQRSLKVFAEPCRLLPPASIRAELRVEIVQREFLFLPQRVRSHLEMHVQKMKLHRHWGLPSRVLESLKPMYPEPRRHRRGQQEVPIDSSPPGPALGDFSHRVPTGSYVSTTVNVRRPKRHPRAAGVLPPVFSLVGTTNLEKIRVRLVKKCVEEQLGAFPATVKLSWRRASLLLRQPLPKLILPGQRHPQARSHLVPFGRREDMDRIAFTVQHKHLMFLWGLSTRYVGALGGMTPKPSSLQPRRPRRVAAAVTVVFSEMRVLFLPEQEKEILEQQVKRKKIQHLWGFPALIEKSVKSFMHNAPSLATCQRISVAVSIQQRDPSFLSPASCRFLELHLQKIKLQHRWGTPGRVLESLKVFHPSGALGKVEREGSPERLPQLRPLPLSPQEQRRFTRTLAFAEERSRQLKPGEDIQQKMEEQEEDEEDEEQDEQEQEEEEEEEKEEEEKKEKEEEEGEEGAEEERQQWEGETSTQDSLKWEEGSAEHSISSGSRHGEREVHAPTCKSPTEPPVSHPTSCTFGMAVGSRTPEKGRKIAMDVSPKRTPPQKESQGEHQGCTPILLKGEVKLSQPRKTVDQKVSLIGSIVEKKLYLKDGLHIWLRDQERQRTHGKGERSGAGEDQGVWQVEAVSAELHWGGTHDGEKGTGVEKEESQADFVPKDSTAETQGLRTTQLEKTHSFQAGSMGSHGGPEGPSMGPASQMIPSRGTHKQVCSSRAQHRAGGGSSRSRSRSRERRRATGPRPSVKAERQRLVHKEQLVRYEGKRLHSKERMSRSKERKWSSKAWKSSSKERKSSSKERKFSSKERRSSSKERKSSSKERKWYSKEWKSSSKERKSSSKERKSRSKERRSSSRKWKLIGKRSSSKEQRSSSRRSSSKEGRSRSSSGKRGSKIRRWLFSGRKKKPESKGEHSSSRQGRSRSRGRSERRQGPSLTQEKEGPRRK